jgi:hypothetical protein
MVTFNFMIKLRIKTILSIDIYSGMKGKYSCLLPYLAALT